MISFVGNHECIIYNYSIDNVVLERSAIAKDLGIWVNPKSNFIDYVNHIIASTYKDYGFIYRNCRDFSLQIKL